MGDKVGILDAIKRFLGLGQDEQELTYDEAIRDLSSKIRMDAVKQRAYQAVQNKDQINSESAHFFEAEILVDCIAVDQSVATHHSEILKKTTGDLQYLDVLMKAGLQGQIQNSSPDAVEHKLEIAIHQNQGEANRIKKFLSGASHALEVFKGANAISRPAAYPESRTNSFYILAAVGIIEAFTNVWFFWGMSNFQIALLLALGAAAINIVGNAWFGFKYREKNLVDKEAAGRGRRYFYYAAGLILLVNALIAWYRYANGNSLSDPKFIFESAILFIIGIILGITSFNKGYALDDPYPGYSELDKCHKDLELELAHLKSQHDAFTADLIMKANAELDRLSDRVATTGIQFANNLPAMASQLDLWQKDHDQVADAYANLINVFRITLCANHPDGRGYTQHVNELPQNTTLNSYREIIDRYMNDRDGLNERLASLKQEVQKAKTELNAWIKTPSAEKLISWP